MKAAKFDLVLWFFEMVMVFRLYVGGRKLMTLNYGIILDLTEGLVLKFMT